MCRKLFLSCLIPVLVVTGAFADSVTHGSTTINMDFVDIGYAGNAGDTANTVNGVNPGAVGYNYRIGKYEVTADQWASVIAADSNVGNTGLNSGAYPAGDINWYEAAKFCNWLTTGNAYSGAYQFNGSGTLTNVMSRAQIAEDGGLFYVLPTGDEWYKAAYFKPDGSGYTLYANGTSVAPSSGDSNIGSSSDWEVGSGTMEQNGTYDMMGNVWEWSESAFDGTLDSMDELRAIRGASSGFNFSANNASSTTRLGFNPSLGFDGNIKMGFRVAAIPEPSTIVFLGMFGGGLLAVRRFFRV